MFKIVPDSIRIEFKEEKKGKKESNNKKKSNKGPAKDDLRNLKQLKQKLSKPKSNKGPAKDDLRNLKQLKQKLSIPKSNKSPPTKKRDLTSNKKSQAPPKLAEEDLYNPKQYKQMPSQNPGLAVPHAQSEQPAKGVTGIVSVLIL